MKKIFNHRPRDKTTILVVLLAICSIIGMSIGYSVFNANLSISGEAYVRVDEEIRVIDFKVIEQTNGAYETYNKKYAKDTTTMFATLPNENSTITYEVTVRNKSSKMYQLKDIIEESNPNANISYEVMNIKIKDLVKKDSTITFQIKLTTSLMDQKTELKLKYLFTLSTACEYDPGQTFTFAYTGAEQTFQVPCDGTYKLETWGAGSGASAKPEHIGGYGGYSSGTINLRKSNILYIVVGGQGETIAGKVEIKIPGGYNGGGDGFTCDSGTLEQGYSSGGGATHIATATGLLASLKNLEDNILIVAGGGGGYGYYYGYLPHRHWGSGGSGGGISGGTNYNVKSYRDPTITVLGGTQSSGYEFGQGEPNGNNSCYSGGGGGFYGGFGSKVFGAAGGSGYIGNPLLTNKAMYCYNCEESSEVDTKTITTTDVSLTAISNQAKIGQGYAQITYLQ